MAVKVTEESNEVATAEINSEETVAQALAAAEEHVEKTESKGVRVFVYGTLKMGHSNHGLLNKATFLGRCKLKGKYRMLNLGWYPGVVHDNNLTTDGEIVGEVYRINEEILSDLDILEGNGSFYTRTQVHTPWKKAWCYFIPSTYLSRRDCAFIENGSWEPTDLEKEYLVVTSVLSAQK